MDRPVSPRRLLAATVSLAAWLAAAGCGTTPDEPRDAATSDAPTRHDASTPDAHADAARTDARVTDSAMPPRTDAGGTDSGATCGLSVGDPTCDACLMSTCCSQERACVNSADCLALLDCLDGGDEATCIAAHPTGAAVLQPVIDCLDTSCGTPCGVTPAQDGGTPVDSGTVHDSGPPPPTDSGTTVHDSGVVTPPPHHVNCSTSTTDPQWASYCSCTGDSNVGATTYAGTCGTQHQSGRFCCAGSGYPSGTSSCGCYETPRATTWNCFGNFDFCSCGFEPPSATNPTSGCDNVPDTSGRPWRCCADSHSGQCACSARPTGGTLAPCTAGEVEVSACTHAPAGWRPAPSSCAALGQTAVAACTPDGNLCRTDSDCGSGCTGTDLFCCPTCTAGRCQTCCTSGGSVSCF